MDAPGQSQPNPRRQAAGRRNRRLRGPLTDAGLGRLRAAALVTQPWRRESIQSSSSAPPQGPFAVATPCLTPKRRNCPLLTLGVLGHLGAFALTGAHSRRVDWWRGEPFWRGRPARYWATEMRGS